MGDPVSVQEVSSDTILAMGSAQLLNGDTVANGATVGHQRNPYAARSLAECGP